MSESLIQIFKSKDGYTEIPVKLEKDTVWLTQKQISDLFEKDKDTIGLHFKNIFNSGELDELSTTEKYSVVQTEGSRKVKRKIKHYNLDAIISVGYWVNSSKNNRNKYFRNFDSIFNYTEFGVIKKSAGSCNIVLSAKYT